MRKEQELDVKEVDAANQMWTCPACEQSVPFTSFDCECGYDARPFLERMARFKSPGAMMIAGLRPKRQKRKYKISAGFIVRLVIYGGWAICALTILATLGTIAMIVPAMLFGVFTLGILALDSQNKKNRKKPKTAEELAGVAQNLLDLAEELSAGKRRK